MEVDDDFGDLYSDVLLPVPAKPPCPPSNPNPSPGPNPVVSSLSASAAASSAPATTSAAVARAIDDDDDWITGEAAPATIDPTSNWADEDDQGSKNPSRDEKPRVSAPSSDRTAHGGPYKAVTADVADRDEQPSAIPGLGAVVSPTVSDGWDDSDSEDDLKIVLNDDDHRAMDDLGYGDGDEEEDLVIVTNDDQIGPMDQDWGEGAGPGGEGEGKEGDGSKDAGVGNAGGAGPSRIGYSSHPFHQHHAMYKVRDACPQPELSLLCREFVYTVALHLFLCNSLASQRKKSCLCNTRKFDKSNTLIGIDLTF